MITVIRNDREARFAHDIYGIKINEELPKYKIIGTTRNEGICIYESCNYAAVAHTFDLIVEAISNGEQSILINPPVVDHRLSKEEFFDQCECAVHDLRCIDDDHPIKHTEDLYGRPITPDNHTVNEHPERYQPDFYAWNTEERNFGHLDKNSFDNRYLNNVNPYMG